MVHRLLPVCITHRPVCALLRPGCPGARTSARMEAVPGEGVRDRAALGALLRRQPQVILGSASYSRRSAPEWHYDCRWSLRALVSPQQPGPPEAVTCLPPLAEIMDELAAELGFAYTVQAADLDERALGAGAAGPAELVMLLARAKAAALQGRLEAAARPGPGGSACSAPQTAALAERAGERTAGRGGEAAAAGPAGGPAGPQAGPGARAAADGPAAGAHLM